MTPLSREQLEQCHLRARSAASLYRLPFRRRTWRGVQGNWQGAGTGSSLDFQDHRPYVPGDDPRYINWLAYARSGHYTMKLYRQEVSPSLDLLLDCSASMFVDEAKSLRVAELLYWCFECGLQSGAALRMYLWAGDDIEPVSIDAVAGHTWLRTVATGEHSPVLPAMPWRHGSLRVIISDLLWPGDAQPIFQSLADRQGFGVVIAPFSPEEAQPSWSGNMEMHDCESSRIRAQRVDTSLLERYRAAYLRHFSHWEEQALRYHIPLARLSAGGELTEAMRIHAGESGAMEWAG